MICFVLNNNVVISLQISVVLISYKVDTEIMVCIKSLLPHSYAKMVIWIADV